MRIEFIQSHALFQFHSSAWPIQKGLVVGVKTLPGRRGAGNGILKDAEPSHPKRSHPDRLLQEAGPAGTLTGGLGGLWIGTTTPGLAAAGMESDAFFGVGRSFITAGSRGVTVKPRGLIPGTFS